MHINDIKYLEGAYKWAAIETIGKLEEKYKLELPSDIALKNSLIETLESADPLYKKAAVRLVSLFRDEEICEKVLSIYGNDNSIDEKLQIYFSKNLNLFFKVVVKYIKADILNAKQIIELIKDMITVDNGASLQVLNDFEIRSFIDLFTKELTNSDEEVRSNSMELLFFFDLETALMFSDTMMEDSVSWNRLKLLEIIQYADHPRITEVIKRFSNDQDEMVRENAQTILNERGITNLKLRNEEC